MNILVAQELVDARRREFEHRAAMYRLVRETAAVEARPGLVERWSNRVGAAARSLRPVRTRMVVAPRSQRNDCCTCSA